VDEDDTESLASLMDFSVASSNPDCFYDNSPSCPMQHEIEIGLSYLN
jgi:hypothetical protein